MLPLKMRRRAVNSKAWRRERSKFHFQDELMRVGSDGGCTSNVALTNVPVPPKTVAPRKSNIDYSFQQP